MTQVHAEILGVPKDEIIANLAVVKSTFGDAWIGASNGQHKLQALWRRRDALSRIELMSLGDSISTMNAIDPKWVGERVAGIKAHNETCHGLLFEILGGAMLARGGSKFRPTQRNTPGVDGIIEYPDGFQIRMSLKNHDISSQELFFREQCRLTREVARRSFTDKVVAFRLLIEARETLSLPEWNRLRAAVANPQGLLASSVVDEVVPGKAAMIVSKLVPDAQDSRFSPTHCSDSFLAISAYHKNEQKNFCDKVYTAALNMRKHAPRLANSLNAIFIRLHHTASLAEIEKYAAALLNDDLDAEVDGIMLYQPSVVRQEERSIVSHHFRFIGTARWSELGRPFQINVVFGGMSTEPSRIPIMIAGQSPLKLDGKYFFQAGDHYYLANAEGDSWAGSAAAIAPGILVHTVFSEPAPGMVISGLFPQDEELVIL